LHQHSLEQLWFKFQLSTTHFNFTKFRQKSHLSTIYDNFVMAVATKVAEIRKFFVRIQIFEPSCVLMRFSTFSDTCHLRRKRRPNIGIFRQFQSFDNALLSHLLTDFEIFSFHILFRKRAIFKLSRDSRFYFRFQETKNLTFLGPRSWIFVELNFRPLCITYAIDWHENQLRNNLGQKWSQISHCAFPFSRS